MGGFDSLKDDLKHIIQHLASDVWSQLKRKSKVHWLIVVSLLIAGTFLGHKLGQQNFWIDFRYKAYQLFLDRITPRTPHPRRTVVVLIEDDEYWNGPLARRSPLKRDYLADLIHKIDEANPEVIGIDVDLRSPTPNKGAEEVQEYQAETNKLLETVKTVSHNRTVVLSRSVKNASEDETKYEVEPSVFDNFNFDGGKVLRGYIELPKDIRQVPLALTLKDRTTLDSFASAIVRAVDEKSLEDAQKDKSDTLPYGTFIQPENFKRYSSAHILESDPKTLKDALGFKVVIVGGGWHTFSLGHGPMNDSHPSPVGEIFGAFVHANYVEALLDARAYPPMRESFAVSLEIVVTVILALFFSLEIRLLIKLGVALILSLVLISISYFAWQNLGLFFDFFVPIVLLLGHAVVEKFRE